MPSGGKGFSFNEVTHEEELRLRLTSDSLRDADSAPARAHPELQAVGQWTILEKLGVGGMSVVYRGQHSVMQLPVAIKLLDPNRSSQESVLMRLQQEAKAIAALRHTNIVGVHDCGVAEDGRAYIVMELMNGVALDKIIRQSGALDPTRALSLFLQIGSAVSYAHLNKVIHRDLKPSNVIVVEDKNGQELAKLCDFGIAKIENDENAQRLTKTG
ncbi:MAG: serine/threonine-protein kinase, partial [Terriglobales bacterium]